MVINHQIIQAIYLNNLISFNIWQIAIANMIYKKKVNQQTVIHKKQTNKMTKYKTRK